MVDESFFIESKQQSQVKARIVAKYFASWASVIKPSARKAGNRIDYIDLFCGPGKYEDGTLSTPLLVLQAALKDPDLSQMLFATFNDKDKRNCARLDAALKDLPGLEKLKHKPRILNIEVGKDVATELSSIRLNPTLLFADPWGYKGLSLQLFSAVLKDWACECIFFFNYRRVNSALGYEGFKQSMDALFGKVRAQSLRDVLWGMSSREREEKIIGELENGLHGMGGKFVLPFRFLDDKGTRTSHYLVFTTKNFKGFEIMREIMAMESTASYQGVPSYEYCAQDIAGNIQLDLGLIRPLDDLKKLLLQDFSDQRVKMKQIYELHSSNRPYLERNYKDALIELEGAGLITAAPPAQKRRKREGRVTFGPNVVVTFPPMEEG